MARSLKPISLLDGEIPADQHDRPRSEQATTPAKADAPHSERRSRPPKARPRSAGRQPAGARSEGASEQLEAGSSNGAAPVAPKSVHGHLEHVALMLPPALWESYDDLAFDLSEAGATRVSTSALIKAVLFNRLPATEEEAHQLAVDWVEVRSEADDPYGHEAPVQRNILLYASQRGSLDRLARKLRRRRLPGARSKLICAVLHFRRPAGVAEARELVRASRLAEHQS